MRIVTATTKYWMALSSVKGVGPKTVRVLVSSFGSPERVLAAPDIEIARFLRSDLQLARDIVGVKRELAGIEEFIERTSGSGIDVLCPDSSEYPHLLKLAADFPPILYRKGARFPEGEPAVAIVGTRFPTSAGAKAAEDMAAELASRGFVVVSGLAKGIDTAAHRGALRAGGKTLAILGSGLKMVYPPENRQLADDICVGCAVLSECHPNEVVSRRRLIQRNRIVSGMASGVILVEPGRGALNTAERALRQDRHVFAHDPHDTLAGLLHEEILPIRGIDAVVDRLQATKKDGSDVYLL